MMTFEAWNGKCCIHWKHAVRKWNDHINAKVRWLPLKHAVLKWNELIIFQACSTKMKWHLKTYNNKSKMMTVLQMKWSHF